MVVAIRAQEQALARVVYGPQTPAEIPSTDVPIGTKPTSIPPTNGKKLRFAALDPLLERKA